ncbi:hypothetical protein [Nocardioides sp.]|uniref:hypothetical protein n=1 Tax=Nocardioides sp. TaxID=35761 RepID=UPI003D0D2D5B
MNSETFRPTVRTQQDLERTWRHLMEPLGFGLHQVWVMLIGADDRPIPHLIEIPDALEPPGEHEVAGLGTFLAGLQRDVLGPGGRIAFLRSRPGSDDVQPEDRQWARALRAACRAEQVPCDVVHLANDQMLVPLPFDEVI